MARVNPFAVTVYSKGLAFQQSLGSALSYSFTPRFTLGTGEVITRADDPANTLLAQPGARMVVVYRGEVLLSGFVSQRTGDVIKGGVVTWQVFDDRYLLAFVRAYVRPGANLTPTSLADLAQQQPYGTHTDGRADGLGYYAFAAGVNTAEAAIKAVITANLARFGSNVAQGRIVVQPDLGRGGDARAAGMLPQLRFESLHDGLLDLLDWSGLLLRVWQEPNALGVAGSIKLDVVAPVTWAQTISTSSRIVRDGQYQLGIPSATRVILGGPGDDAARLFYGAADATGLEDTYGIAVEAFVDATGATLKWPDGLADAAQAALYYLQRTDVTAADKLVLSTYLAQAASTALAAGKPLAGLSISLSETASFHYGGTDGYHVGDRIAVSVEGGPTITQRITECTLTYAASGGFSVTPKVGDITDDASEQLARAIAGIASVVSRISTRT